MPRAANKLVEWRKARGMSQETFAEFLDVRQATVSGWEGGTKIPRTLHALRIEELTSNYVVVADWKVLEPRKKAA